MPLFHIASVSGPGKDSSGVTAILEFDCFSNRECHDVTLIQDDECEPIPENFFADLSLVTGSNVIVDPALIRVDSDDSLEDEWGESMKLIILYGLSKQVL